MNTRNRFRDFLFALATAATFLALQPAALAADPPKPTQQQVRAQDRDARLCKKYVREHRGHPGKGIDIVKVVYVPCPKKEKG